MTEGNLKDEMTKDEMTKRCSKASRRFVKSCSQMRGYSLISGKCCHPFYVISFLFIITNFFNFQLVLAN